MPTRGKRKKKTKKYVTTKKGLPLIRQTKELPRTIKKTHQLGGVSDVIWDLRKVALEPGKRLSKRGRVYYEYRRNRSDEDPRKRL